jgi:hypothetical protein
LNHSATLPPITPNTIQASNDTSEGRARNRRPDIVILNPPAPEPAIGAPPFATDNSKSGGSTP